MKLNTRAFAIASAGAGMLAYALGAVLDSISPWGGAAIVSFIFRVDVIELARPLTLGSLLIGLAAFGVCGGVMGGFVAGAYNALTRPATGHIAKPVPQT